jgi:hypothetical protein
MRGHDVEVGSEAEYAHLYFTVGLHRYPVVMKEELDGVPHVRTSAEEKKAERSPWIRIPERDHVPSARLRIELPTTLRDDKWHWSDRKRWTLDDRLGDVIVELEYRSVVDDAKEAAIQQVLDRRQGEWEIAIERAKDAHSETFRVGQLDEQLRARMYVDSLRSWASKVEEESVRLGHDVEPRVTQWVDWIRARAERIDPLNPLPAWPQIPEPEPEPEALKPFLGNVNPHRPDNRRPWVR